MAAVDLVNAIVARHTSFKRKGKSVAIMTPFNHVARGISLDPTIGRNDAYYIGWFFFFPARPFEGIDLGNGNRLGYGVWDVTNATAIAEAVAAIESEAMPKLERSSTPEGALELLLSRPQEYRLERWYEEYAYALAVLGRWKEALNALDDMRAASKGDQRSWAVEMRAKADRLHDAIQLGPDAVRTLIAENERYSLGKCHLAKLLLDSE